MNRHPKKQLHKHGVVMGRYHTIFQPQDLRPSGRRPIFLKNVRRLIDGKWRWVKVYESEYDMRLRLQKERGTYWEARRPSSKLSCSINSLISED